MRKRERKISHTYLLDMLYHQSNFARVKDPFFLPGSSDMLAL